MVLVIFQPSLFAYVFLEEIQQDTDAALNHTQGIGITCPILDKRVLINVGGHDLLNAYL